MNVKHAVLMAAAFFLVGCTAMNEALLERLRLALSPEGQTESVSVSDRPSRETVEEEALQEEEPGGEEEEQPPDKETASASAAAPNVRNVFEAPSVPPPDVRELLTPTVQLSLIAMSIDSFDDFALYNTGFFENTLYSIFRLEGAAYEEGERTALLFRTAGRELIIQKALLGTDEEGSRWWQVVMEPPNERKVYEVLVSPDAVPLLVRYENPQTGEIYEYVPYLAGYYREARASGWTDEFLEDLEEELSYAWEAEWGLSYNAPELLGREEIAVGAGRFEAFHIRDELEWGIHMDYWVSPHIPGGIVRIVEGHAEEEPRLIAELTARGSGAVSAFEESDLIPIDASSFLYSDGPRAGKHVSEGTPEAPIALPPVYEGKVGSGGTSYYSFTLSKRSDIFIEVLDLSGNAELRYFADDATFSEWVSSSSGLNLSIEDCYLDGETTVYLSVTDFPDPIAEGQGFTILTYENPILSPLGIMKRGFIYTQAEKIEIGDIVHDRLNEYCLNYYKTAAGRGSHLRIRADDLPESAELIWFGTEGGGYSEAYTSYQQTAIQIDVTGLSEETICYYYVAADPAAAGRLGRFQITVTEIEN